MSQQAAKRRRKQLVMNNRHLAKLGRPHYSKRGGNRNIHEAIAAERAKAIRMANAKKGK
jgi:hypothetical protein